MDKEAYALIYIFRTAPYLLQRLIRATYEHGTKAIKIDGTTVLPFALFEVLDGTDTNDYVSLSRFVAIVCTGQTRRTDCQGILSVGSDCGTGDYG